METKTQTSFIPKKTSANSDFSSRIRQPRSLFSIISSGVFYVTILVAVGVFGYSMFISSDNERLHKLITDQITENFPDNDPFIEDLTDLKAKMNVSEMILGSHVSMSSLFSLLQSVTLKNIQFDNLSYTSAPDGGIKITMSGRGRGYNAVISQLEELKGHNYFKSVSFSNFLLDEKGNVTFDAEAELEQDAVSYEKLVTPVEGTSYNTSYLKNNNE